MFFPKSHRIPQMQSTQLKLNRQFDQKNLVKCGLESRAQKKWDQMRNIQQMALLLICVTTRPFVSAAYNYTSNAFQQHTR